MTEECGQRASRAAVCCKLVSRQASLDHTITVTNYAKRRVFARYPPFDAGTAPVYTHWVSVTGFLFGCPLRPLCSQTTVGVVVNHWLVLAVALVHDDALFTAKVRLSHTIHIRTTSCAICLHFSNSLCARVACGLVGHIALTRISSVSQRAFLSTQLPPTNLYTL